MCSPQASSRWEIDAVNTNAERNLSNEFMSVCRHAAPPSCLCYHVRQFRIAWPCPPRSGAAALGSRARHSPPRAFVSSVRGPSKTPPPHTPTFTSRHTRAHTQQEDTRMLWAVILIHRHPAPQSQSARASSSPGRPGSRRAGSSECWARPRSGGRPAAAPAFGSTQTPGQQFSSR